MKARGFTLVETLAVISMFTILSFVLINTIVLFYRSNAYTLAQTAEVDSARRGMQSLVRDIAAAHSW